MINIKNTLINNKKELKQLLFLLFIGFLFGLLIIRKLNINPILEEIKNIDIYIKENSINFLSSHFIVISLLIISSLFIIGVILFPVYLLYESTCILFNIYTLSMVYKLNGFAYSILYNIITKLILMIMLLKIFKSLIKIGKTIIKKEKNKKEIIIKYLKQAFIYFSIIIINDFLLYFLGNKILSMLLFIIK